MSTLCNGPVTSGTFFRSWAVVFVRSSPFSDRSSGPTEIQAESLSFQDVNNLRSCWEAHRIARSSLVHPQAQNHEVAATALQPSVIYPLADDLGSVVGWRTGYKQNILTAGSETHKRRSPERPLPRFWEQPVLTNCLPTLPACPSDSHKFCF